MSAERAIQAAGDAANSNAASGRAIILFTDGKAVHLGRPSIVVAPAELRGAVRPTAAFRSLAMRIVQRLALWRSRARDRRALAAMDARLRNDIGITEIDVWRELNKPFWRE